MDFQAVLSQTLTGMIGPTFVAFAVAAMGLNIHFGYTGLLNFGQAVFMAGGAYGLAMTVVTFNLPGGFLTGVFIGVVIVPAFLTLIMGFPTLRLRSDYLAIVTIAVSEIYRYVVRTPGLSKYFGGVEGLQKFANGFYKYNWLDVKKQYLGLFFGQDMYFLIVAWIVVALVGLLSWLLIRSPWGRVLKAIREDEDAAVSLGKNTFRFKMQALYLGGVLGAIGGLLRAVAQQSAIPDQFITDVTFFVWVALILGGAGRVLAPIVGASLLWGTVNFTDSFLREAGAAGWYSDSLFSDELLGQIRYLMIGIALVLLAAFRPQGIFGSKEEMALDDR